MCMFVCTQAQACVHMHACACRCVRTYSGCAHVHACEGAQVNARMRAHMCMHTHVDVHIRMCDVCVHAYIVVEYLPTTYNNIDAKIKKGFCDECSNPS